MIIAATGHRPDKLGGYSIEVQGNLCMLAQKHIIQLKPTEVISGMALGWDMAVAEVTLMSNIPLICAVPFKGQEQLWPLQSRAMYHAILKKASRVEIVSPGDYAAWKMSIRNKWMVNRADHILALWNGSPGGTANCINDANKRQLPITNVWDEWSKR